MARLYQASVSPRSTRGTGGPRFRCPSPRFPQAHPPLCLPISPHTHPGPPEAAPNLPSRSPHPQSPLHPGHRQTRPLQVPQRNPRRRARSLSLAPKKNAFRPALQLSRARTEETRALNAAYHERIHRDQSNLIPLGSGGFHPNGSRTPLQRPLPPKRHGPGWPSPGAGLPRSSLAPPSSLPRERRTNYITAILV
jgi:hypothetical protein